MNINNILENEELNKLLNSSILKTYYRFKLSFIIDVEDFTQEVYLFIMPRLKNFDDEKSTMKTYLPMLVMTCAKNCIQSANGQSKFHNKLEFENNTISLEGEFQNSENGDFKMNEVLGESDITYLKLLIDEILNISCLTEKQKTIILLMSKGYSISDIANMQNKTPSCVNITFQRAREKIVNKYTY